MAFDLGDAVPLTTEILDAAGDRIAASGVVCTIIQPDGTTLTPSPTNPSIGLFAVDFVPTQWGRHLERWTATSPATARSDSFDVRPPAPAYILSLADAKEHLNKTTTEHDEELRFWLEVVGELVDELSGRVSARRSVTEVFEIADGWADHLVLSWAPVLSLTTVALVDGATTWDVGNLDVDPQTGIVRVRSGASLCGPLRITYVAGAESVSRRLAGAARIILRHLWESQRASVGAGKRARSGMVDDSMQLVAGYAIPRAAADLIGPRAPMVA